MTCKVLFFDLRESEKSFFENNDFENYDIKFFTGSLNEKTVETLTEKDLEETVIVSVFITSDITQKVISKFKNLRLIATRSTGCDHIEFSSCLNKNIALINVEKYGNTSVAQFTFALILSLVRHLFPAIDAVKNSKCIKQTYTGRNLDSMTIGIIGTGAIGAGVCSIAHGFNMKILAFDPYPKKELEQNYNVVYTGLEELLENSDIVSIHTPYNEKNYHMMSENQFARMKKNSYFINVSRGELVNLEALLKYIKSGKISGAGLDVVACLDSDCLEEVKKLERSSLTCFENSAVVKELNSCQNVIITPHMAYDTKESVEYILQMTFDGIQDFISGGNKHRVF